jgi:hypothetical protein
MPSDLDPKQREVIATKLADLKALQRLLITNEQKLIVECSEDGEIERSIDEMLEEDRENLKIIEKVIAAFGETPAPKKITQDQMHTVERLMALHELAAYEKILQHEGLKQRSVMTGLLLHKVAQVYGDEVQSAIASLDQVNFCNRTHQEKLKSILLILGTRELTGQNPKQNLWAQAEDGISALRGLIGGIHG